MADKNHQLVIEGLQRAADEPGGLPLFTSRKAAGLFANNAAGKKAAQACQDAGYLHFIAATDPKSPQLCTLSHVGLAYLLEQVNPRPVLESLVRAVEARGVEVAGLLGAVQHTHHTLQNLKDLAEKVLAYLPEHQTVDASTAAAAAPALPASILDHLQRWQNSAALDDCPLPDLFRRLLNDHPTMTLGEFHDALRELHSSRSVYLHPWTGPLYQMPEPSFALLSGHEIAYYTSLGTPANIAASSQHANVHAGTVSSINHLQ